jgi:hypothetical protein
VTAELDLDLAFAHHLLAVPADVAPREVGALAASWFPRAGWLGERSLQLAADVVLTGPWSLTGRDRRALHLPAAGTQVFLLRCPVLRDGPPPPELQDPAGISGAFREGVPYGVEAEALAFLLAAARRLGGSLRAAGSGAVLTPDPDAEVNLWVHSPVWLDPEALVTVCRPALPSVRLAMELADSPSPEPPAAPPTVAGAGALEAGEREWLHAEATAFDEAALAQPPVFVAYGAVADLGEDGVLEVAVEGEEAVPLVLQGLDWAQHGVVVYLLRWWPRDERDLVEANPSGELRARRARVRALVERVAVAVHEAAGGEITDESGFLVDPAGLG